MGWTSTYTSQAPTTSERKEELVNQLTFSNDRVDSEALKATMRGSTGYALQKVTDKETGKETVYSVAMLTSYGDNQFATKFVDPIIMYKDFPITWVDKITPRDDNHKEELSQWKDSISQAKKKKNQLKELGAGSIIRVPHLGDLFLEVFPGGKRYWMHYNQQGHCEGYIPTRRFGTNFTVVKEK